MDHADRKLDERETDQVAYHHLRHAIAIGPPLQFFTYTQMKEAQRKTSKNSAKFSPAESEKQEIAGSGHFAA
jgi:hypothetical protein